MDDVMGNFCQMISNKVSDKGSCVCRWEIIGPEGRMKNKVHNLLSEEFCLFQKVSIRPRNRASKLF